MSYIYPTPISSTVFCDKLGQNYRVEAFANRVTFKFKDSLVFYSKYDLKVALEINKNLIQDKDINSIVDFVNEYESIWKGVKKEINVQQTLF